MTKPDLKEQILSSGMRLTDLASALGVNKATVTRWCQNRVPAEVVIGVENATGIPRHKIRPDIYPTDGKSDGAAE